MQNGCFCCTLQDDLVDQIISLAQKNDFNYMLIEASGVSEPSQIAPLFDPCDDTHDHQQAHTKGKRSRIWGAGCSRIHLNSGGSPYLYDYFFTENFPTLFKS